MTVGTPTSRLPTQLFSFTFEADGQIRYVKAASRTRAGRIAVKLRPLSYSTSTYDNLEIRLKLVES